jgi:hypothetical protein
MAKNIPWNYSEKVTPEEFIIKFGGRFKPIMQSMHETDGDMLMSDYRNLLELGWTMSHAVEALKDTKGK